jgi:branched-chain amino acid aminotransferase
VENYVYLNGDFVSEEEAKISVFDRGFLYGDGLFETMRAYGGRVFMLDEHLSRLFHSLDKLRIPLRKDKEELKSAIGRLIELSRLSNAYIRLTVSRGLHRGTLTFNDSYDPTVVIMAKELSPYPQGYYSQGVNVIISDIRQNSFSPLPQHKSLSYLSSILAKEEARIKGAFEAILLNFEGEVTEGATSNVFTVKSEKIFTPPVSSHLLPGVTRKAVLGIIPELNLEVAEKKIAPDEFFTSDEVFLTNSIMEVMPVVEVNNKKIKDGSPGPIYKSVAKAYRELIG